MKAEKLEENGLLNASEDVLIRFVSDSEQEALNSS